MTVGAAEVNRAMKEFATPAMSAPVTLTVGGRKIEISPATLGKHLTMKPDAASARVPAADHSGVTAVLAHVAVTEHARCNGIGAALIAQFVNDAAEASCPRVTLVTSAKGGAGPYYERSGWLCQGETRTPDGRHLLMYDLPLHDGPTPQRH
ncbi:GNAT family N-acetyltransferase [Streptomyces mirabilis]|uniref:GNAT family N-acetyltransferase n=1 Tax=Streptomyces mirabilis TaxID=68239 RepID=UPI003687EBC6